MTHLPRIRVSDNQRFLVTEHGDPFFWLADTAWELFHRLTLDETERYFDNRRAKGFNVIQAVILAELDGLHDPTPAGEVPLIDCDPTKPNEAYFDHVQTVIEMAADKGLYMGVLPTWGDKVNLAWGKGPRIFNQENARIYGQYVGKRFRDHSNIVWINGGDRREVEDGVDYRPVWRALAAGVKSEADQIMTYHPMGVRGSSIAFHEDEWLDFNMWQSSHGDISVPIWDYISADWQREPTKPVLDGEPCYEDIFIQFNPANGTFTPYDIRRRMYRAVFAGGCGQTYGHAAIWQMYASGHTPVLNLHMTWQEGLDRPAVNQVIHLRDLMLSRPYLTRIPDQQMITSDAGVGTKHIRATRDANGRYAMVYIPDSDREVTVDLRKLAGDTVTASWFDPRTGEIEAFGMFSTQTEHTFTTPHSNGPDRVLLLDAVASP